MKIFKKISTALMCLIIATSFSCFAETKVATAIETTESLNSVLTVEFKEMGDYKDGLYTGIIVACGNQDVELRIMNDTLVGNVDIKNLKTGDKLSVLYTQDGFNGKAILPSMIIPRAISLSANGGYLTVIQDVKFNDDSIVITLPDTSKLTLSQNDIAYDWDNELEATVNTLTPDSIIYVQDDKINVLNIAGISEKLVVEESEIYTSYNTPGYEINPINRLGTIVKIETEDYISLRNVFENMGPNYRVYWSAEEGVVLQHNNTKYYISNGESGVKSSKLKVVYSYDDLCAIIRDGTTYIPLSWVSSIFGVGRENIVLPNIKGVKVLA